MILHGPLVTAFAEHRLPVLLNRYEVIYRATFIARDDEPADRRARAMHHFHFQLYFTLYTALTLTIIFTFLHLL